MSFEIPRQITIVAEERRTAHFQVSLYGLRGNDFSAINFIRESVFLDSLGNEVKRGQDSELFEFTPETIAQAPDLAAAIATIHKYLDGADMQRLQAQQ
ncbi:MAG: hypothetical protein RLZZ511_1920 [Cyanobacteriota bacterium]|jgi:hypothetical protein